MYSKTYLRRTFRKHVIVSTCPYSITYSRYIMCLFFNPHVVRVLVLVSRRLSSLEILSIVQTPLIQGGYSTRTQKPLWFHLIVLRTAKLWNSFELNLCTYNNKYNC